MTIKLLKKYLKSLWVIKKLVLHHGKKTQVIEREWWAMTGSNRRLPRCKRGALPAELITLNLFLN